MNGTAARFFRLGVSLAALVTLGWVLTGQAARPAKHHVSLVTDWSHRHLIFSQPRTAEELARATQDPRYAQQIIRRLARPMAPVPIPIEEDIRRISIPSAFGGTHHYRQNALQRDWSENLGSGGALPANVFPAKFSFDVTTASCATDPSPDFVVYSTGLLSSGSQASVVAYDNLYSGCTGTKPSVYWAYDTGGQVLTSPVFSYLGDQVAFVQTNGGGLGTLVILKWAASTTETVGGPLSLTAVAPSAYQACPAPCMTTIILRDHLGTALNDTTSSIYYDYEHDIGWVGGAIGWLHKITGVFKGTPAEVNNLTFPVKVRATTWLSSPVYDKRSGHVFVGDASGYLSYVDATTGIVTSTFPTQLDFGTGFVDSPIVDSGAQVVYAFASADGTAGCTGGADCAAVYQLNTSFPDGNGGSPVQVGNSVIFPAPASPLYSGGFDTPYITSRNGTGNLYVCGNTGGTPIIYQIPIAAGVMGAPTPGPQLSLTTQTPCSPISDIPNTNSAGTTDSIFVSAQTDGINTACAAGGCMYNFVTTEWQPNTMYAQNLEIVDSNFNIQAVVVNGKSGGLPPTWNATVGGTTPDGTAHWQTLGHLSGSAPAVWVASHAYARGRVILDSAGNLEICNVPGSSGTSAPAWMPNVGDITNDAAPLRWKNLGHNPSAAIAAAGGSSGIVMDNVVSSGTLAGASQVYFSTLGTQTCPTSGGSGSCAVQASSPGLN